MEFGVNNNVSFSGKLQNSGKTAEKGQVVKLGQSPDSVELSGKKDKKKFKVKDFAKMSALFYAAAFAAGALISIGRDPAKAAKVLRGTSEIVNPAYKKGAELLEGLLAKQGENYATKFEDILAMFRSEKNSTVLADALDSVEDIIQKNALEPDSKVVEALSTLRKNLQKYVNEMQTSLASGEKVVVYDKSHEFETQNERTAEIIRDFLDDFRFNKMDYEARWSDEGKAIEELQNVFGYKLYSAVRPKGIISECPKDVLDVAQTMYHGTTQASKVYKNGFTPYVSKQIDKHARELGAGIYLTPDSKVAAHFAQIQGSIIPIKLDSGTKVALVDENTYKAFVGKTTDFITDRMTQAGFEALPKAERNAMLELLYQKAFKDAGFDAAYIPKGVQGGFNLFGGDINEAIGKNQSQLILFSPEKLEITSRAPKDRILDFVEKIKSFKNAMKYAIDNPLAMLGV